MTEFVDRNMQAMAGEIMAMKASKLYTEAETTILQKKRQQWEYKIVASKNLQDFSDYINHEKAVVKQIQLRRLQLHINEHKSTIEYSILKRIKRLYELALHRFSNNPTFYLSYFKFCRQSKMGALSTVVQNMYRACADKPQVWQIAAGWYAHDCRDLTKALSVLNKGVSLHKDNQSLYTDAVKLCLSSLKESESKDDKSVTKKICAQIETYVEAICTNITDAQYFIEILDLLASYKDTQKIQNLIIDNLLKKHSNQEFVWHTLAQREKRGLHYSQNSANENKLKLCFDKYREGLDKVDPSDRPKLWSQYLDCIVTAKLEKSDLPGIEITKLLKEHLKEASDQKCLSEKYYIIWVEQSSDKEIPEILEKATTDVPESVDLWKLRLCCAMKAEKNAEVDKVFKDGTEKLQNMSLPLWLMYIRYYNSLSRDNFVFKIYENGLTYPKEISNALKPKFINWLALCKGVEAARKVYDALAKQEPYCKELHAAMSVLESTEIEYKYDRWEKVHKLACEQFSEDPDVWLNYVNFRLYTADVEEIRKKAEEALDTFSYMEFKDKYDKILMEFSEK